MVSVMNNKENMLPCYPRAVATTKESKPDGVVKSGVVYLHQEGRRARVVLTVYAANFDFYAVVSQDKVLTKDCGFINLKKCRVHQQEGENCSFQLIPEKDCDGSVMTFGVASPQDLASWVDVLNSSKKTIRSSSRLTAPMGIRRVNPNQMARKSPLGVSRKKQTQVNKGVAPAPLMPALAEDEEAEDIEE